MTDDARTNRFFLLKQLTPKFHSDTISDLLYVLQGVENHCMPEYAFKPETTYEFLTIEDYDIDKMVLNL